MPIVFYVDRETVLDHEKVFDCSACGAVILSSRRKKHTDFHAQIDRMQTQIDILLCAMALVE